MRADGLVTDIADAARADHVCWVYQDDADLTDVAGRYFAEGLARGERLLWIREAGAATVPAWPGALADPAALLARGALQVLDPWAGHRGSGPFGPDAQLTFYGQATRQARQAGFTGLRVVADVSGVAADPGRRRDLVRSEHVADAFIGSGAGMVALCAYRADLCPDALGDVTSVHPLVRSPGGGPPFRMWSDRGATVLAGALDTFGADRLGRMLAGTPAERPVTRLDLSRVDFVDVGGCRTLARWARGLQDGGTGVEMTGTSRVFRRMWRLLGFEDCVAVSFPEPPA